MAEKMELSKSSSAWAADTSSKLALLASTANHICSNTDRISKALLSHLSIRLEKLAEVLRELHTQPESCLSQPEDANKMDMEGKATEELIADFSDKCALYVLLCCSKLVERLEAIYAGFAAVINAICLDHCSHSFKICVSEAKQLLEHGTLKLGPKEHILCDSLDQGVLESILSDSSLTAKVTQQIADCLGLPLHSEGFANELSKLKLQKPIAEAQKGKAHSLYLEQFIALLEKAIEAKYKPLAPENKENATPPYRQSPIRDTPLLPLQSFICPITKDVMKDPVQIASGQTYERSGIERWFAEGHTRCPTGVELKNTKMKPNYALRQSIAEWRERNYNIRIENAHECIQSEDQEKQLKAVSELRVLCEEDSLNKYKVASKNLVPVLLHLLESHDPELSKAAFSTLGTLAKENTENQEIMVKEGIIDVTVKVLAQQRNDTPQCVHLLRLLSETPDIAERISHAPSLLLFLVTLMKDEECSHDIQATLENLPTSDENVVVMAEANLMKPLVTRLNEGGDASRVLMAKTLGRLHMPDNCKSFVATEESLLTLIKMINSMNEDEREASISALENLTSVSSVSHSLEELGAMPILLKILKEVKYPEEVKKGSAHIMANVLIATGDGWVGKERELEELICIFLQFLGPLGSAKVQCHLLKALYGLACGKRICDFAKEQLKKWQAFDLLLKLLEASKVLEVKKGALELFSCLSNAYGEDASRALKAQPGALNILLEMLRDDSLESERLAVTAILADLPSDDTHVLSVLSQAEILPLLIQFLQSRNELLPEAAAGAVLRFTEPARVEWQRKLAALGLIQQFINLLHSQRSLTKERAARGLANFSLSTPNLSLMPPPLRWWQCFKQRVQVCKVHDGVCSVETTFCLFKAGAVNPLIAILRDEDTGCVKAALDALMTLIDSDDGCRIIAQANGLQLIIGLMSRESPDIQLLAATICERFFNYAEYTNRYAAAAQMHVLALVQRGPPPTRHVAGRILRRLELLESQSNYFGLS